MDENNHIALFAMANRTYEYAIGNAKMVRFSEEIKRKYKKNGAWNESLINQKNFLEEKITDIAYTDYSRTPPPGIEGLNPEEQKKFLDDFKLLLSKNEDIEIRVQGQHENYFQLLTDDALIDGTAYRILPKDFKQRYDDKSMLMSRLTINVKKEYFISLAQALMQIYEHDPEKKIMQSKIMGPKRLGVLTDQAVIYLSGANLQDAIKIGQQLKALLPEDALIEHVPIGMYYIDKGISYSETLKGQSSSHGESRSEIVAKAVTESLLTDKPIDLCFEHQLRIHGYDVQYPALVSQSVREAYVDMSLTGGSNTPESVPSKDIEIFKRDPRSFAYQYRINTQALNAILQISFEGKVIFTKGLNYDYFIEFVDDSYDVNSINSIDCYFLDSRTRNKESKQVEYVDIPINNPEKKYLFTGLLRGGSVVVTELNSETYRVYRDSRSDASLLYDNVVMAVDERDYFIKERHITKASLFMHFNEGKWQMVIQPQETRFALRPEKFLVQTLIPGSYSLADKQQRFNQYRNKTHEALKTAAKKVNVTFGDIPHDEEIFQEPSEENTSVRTWLDIGDKVKQKLDNQIIELNKQRKILEDKLLKTVDVEKRSILKETIEMSKTIILLNQKQYGELFYELRDLEYSWLWQRMKSQGGMSAVVQTSDYSTNMGMNNSYDYHLTVNERYENLIYLHKSTRNLRFRNEFNNGIKHYKEVSLPETDKSMSSQQLKKLYVTYKYSAKERGALYRLIQDVGHFEYVSRILTQTEKMSELFYKLGSKSNRLIPQDFYLSLIKNDSGGRCYPLVRAMSVALARDGIDGANTLIDKLYTAAASPDSKDTALLQMSLQGLHSNVSAVEASFSHGVMNLKQMQTLLEIKLETKMFAVNSKSHAMLIGKVVSDGQSTYYFYDPNFGLFSFKDSKKLFSALKAFFVENKMAEYYSAYERNKKPAFELVFINTDEMGKVSVGNHLVVNNLSTPEELIKVSRREKKVDGLIYQQNEIKNDIQLKSSLAILDAEQWGEKINASLINLASENLLNDEWVPLFDSIEAVENEHYKIKFINVENSELTRWVETTDQNFIQFQRYSKEQMKKFKQYYSFEDGGIQENFSEFNVQSVDGLNAGIAIQSLIQWVIDKNRDVSSGRKNSHNLYLALKIHSYLNYSMMAYGTVNDVEKIRQIIKLGLSSESNVTLKEMNSFFSSLARTANEGINMLFSGALVGFDIYELTHAENEPQRIIFGTQMAFDSAGLTTGAAGLGLGAMGSAGAATALGSASVIIAGLGIGFAGLARNFAIIGEDAKSVGRYFYALDQAYQSNGYEYISDSKILKPKFGAIFSVIDLKNSQITFDSQYIYRTTPSSAGGGRRNYIFWGGNFPTMMMDKQLALNIRREIGYPKATHSVDFSHADAIVLPVIPKSYIKYSHNLWPGATSRHDSGFDIIRRIEKTDKFDFDFYIFPSENIITQISHEYVDSSIDILLDENYRELIVPILDSEWDGKIEYRIKGNGGEYKISLNKGIKIFLSEDESNNKPSKWIIDSSLLSSDTVEIKNNTLSIGGVNVELDVTHLQGKIQLVNKKNEVSEVDFISGDIHLLSEDESQWRSSSESLDSYLQHYVDKHQSHSQYIVIDNHQIDGRNTGKAYYDVTNKRYIFINTESKNKQLAILGDVYDKDAYFYLPTKNVIWRVDINTGFILTEYQLESSANRSFEIIQFWKGNNHIYFSCRYIDTNEVALFELKQDKVSLLSLNAASTLLMTLAQTSTNLTQESSQSILHDYMLKGIKKEQEQSSHIGSGLMDMVSVSGVDTNQAEHRYWIRSTDMTLIKPNLSPSLGHGEPVMEPNLPQSHWPKPHDLALIGSVFNHAGTEVFYFYSAKNKELYRQIGAGQNILNSSKPTAWYMNIPFLDNAVFLQGNLYVIDTQGVMAKVDVEGKLHLAGFNEKWLTENPRWWNELQRYSTDNAAVLLGIRDPSGKLTLPAWYYRGQIIIASDFSTDNNMQFLGMNPDNRDAIIFDLDKKKLYSQPMVTPDELNAAFGQGHQLMDYERLPKAREMYPSLRFTNITNLGHGLLMSADNGDILYIDIHADERKVTGAHLGSSLIIRGGNSNDMLSPSIINNVKNIILSAGDGQDTYLISKDSWQHYQAIIIDNDANDSLVDTLRLPIDNIDSLVVTRHDDDLFITDMEFKTVLILRQVFGMQKQSHRHMQLHFEDPSISLSVGQFADSYASIGGTLTSQRDEIIEKNIDDDAHMLIMSEQMAALQGSGYMGIPRLGTQLAPSMEQGNYIFENNRVG
ncbi:TPA: TcdA/TcdB pore-forming domain-containing protein [Providencia alcalifaciens]